MHPSQWLQRHQIAVYAVAVAFAAVLGSYWASPPLALQRLIDPVLAVLLYVTFLEIPFVRFRRAFTDTRFLAAALGMNFLVVPAVAWTLTRFLPPDPALLVGVFLVLLTPCVDYVIAFTGLAGGDAERLTATTPVLLLAQLLFLPAYLWLFVGARAASLVDAAPFVEAFALIIALPLLAAWATEAWADRRPAGRRWQAAMGWLPVPLMAVTLFVVIASQLPRVAESLHRVAVVVPVYLAFLVVVPVLAALAVRALRLDVAVGRALVFTAVTRNSLVVLPLALALPAAYHVVPAVVVTQTLVELLGMLVLTRVVPRWLVPDTSLEPAASE